MKKRRLLVLIVVFLIVIGVYIKVTSIPPGKNEEIQCDARAVAESDPFVQEQLSNGYHFESIDNGMVWYWKSHHPPEAIAVTVNLANCSIKEIRQFP
jgi:hypothetical protein